jgi:hypothetical protein
MISSRRTYRRNPPAVPGHLRLPLPPLEDAFQVEGRRVAHRDQVPGAGQSVDLMFHDIARRSGEPVQDEVGVPLEVERIDLGPLAALVDVLDGQAVDAEALAQAVELGPIGIDEVQPDDTLTLRQDLGYPVWVEVLLEATVPVQPAGQHDAASLAQGRGPWIGARMTITDLTRRSP